MMLMSPSPCRSPMELGGTCQLSNKRGYNSNNPRHSELEGLMIRLKLLETYRKFLIASAVFLDFGIVPLINIDMLLAL